MEKAVQYEECTKEELIRIIVNQDQTIRELSQALAELKKEMEGLKHPVRKDSTNSSIPSSKDLIKRTRSQRQKSGKKPGGQPGHVGHHREYHAHPDKIIKVEASHCADCGASLERREGTIGLIAKAGRPSSNEACGDGVSPSDQGLCLRTPQ